MLEVGTLQCWRSCLPLSETLLTCLGVLLYALHIMQGVHAVNRQTTKQLSGMFA